ncbi:hypothetical protein LCGC14_1392790 [marine sediment metagenome]|uniref:Uncharacterized protein n=1 Tax=marine sediment metagenome TaxID=412755 RepID=A0A0F9JZM3_9ZZZZ
MSPQIYLRPPLAERCVLLGRRYSSVSSSGALVELCGGSSFGLRWILLGLATILRCFDGAATKLSASLPLRAT